MTKLVQTERKSKFICIFLRRFLIAVLRSAEIKYTYSLLSLIVHFVLLVVLLGG